MNFRIGLGVISLLLLSSCASMVSVKGVHDTNCVKFVECSEEPEVIELPTHEKLLSLPPAVEKPVIAVCREEEKNVSVKLGLKKVYTILEIADSISDAIVNGEKYLIEIGSKILTDLKKNPEKNQGFAEKEGFEPPEV